MVGGDIVALAPDPWDPETKAGLLFLSGLLSFGGDGLA
jgi:hypothetical protein